MNVHPFPLGCSGFRSSQDVDLDSRRIQETEEYPNQLHQQQGLITDVRADIHDSPPRLNGPLDGPGRFPLIGPEDKRLMRLPVHPQAMTRQRIPKLEDLELVQANPIN